MNLIKRFLPILICIIALILLLDMVLFFKPPANKTLLLETTSPGGSYTIRAYLSPETLTTSSMIWCEYDANHIIGWTKEVYRGYRENTVHIKWLEDDTVVINNKILILPFDKYDFRIKNNRLKTYIATP